MARKENVTNRNRIKQLRLEQHKTQKEVGEAVGLSDRAIAHYEKGIREPKLETWMKLADFFNVPVSYLQGFNKNTFWDGALNAENKDILNKIASYNMDNETVNFLNDEENRKALNDFQILLTAIKQTERYHQNNIDKVNRIDPKGIRDIVSMTRCIFGLAIDAYTDNKEAKETLSKIKKVYRNYMDKVIEQDMKNYPYQKKDSEHNE